MIYSVCGNVNNVVYFTYRMRLPVELRSLSPKRAHCRMNSALLMYVTCTSYMCIHTVLDAYV